MLLSRSPVQGAWVQLSMVISTLIFYSSCPSSENSPTTCSLASLAEHHPDSMCMSGKCIRAGEMQELGAPSTTWKICLWNNRYDSKTPLHIKQQNKEKTSNVPEPQRNAHVPPAQWAQKLFSSLLAIHRNVSLQKGSLPQRHFSKRMEMPVLPCSAIMRESLELVGKGRW